MGIGYAVFCRPADAATVIESAHGIGYRAMVGGHVEEGPRRVIVDLLDVTYEEAELQFAS